MKSQIIAAILVVLSSSAFADGEQRDGQGCIWTDERGSCGMQLISPENIPMTCELRAEALTRNGRKIESKKTVTMKPWQVDKVEVFSSKSDPIVRMFGSAKCSK